MKRRLISFTFCVWFICCLLTPVVCAASVNSTENVTITVYENFSATEDSLIFENTTTFQTTAFCTGIDGAFYISGNIPSGNSYNISISIADGKITSATEENNNYAVLSILLFDPTVRIILKDIGENNIYYIEFDNSDLADLKAYKINWYHSFLAPEVESVLQPSSRTVSSPELPYSATTTIFGDIYKENLILVFDNDWDNPVYTGKGFSVITKMILKSKTTEITRYGTTTPIVEDGNSLFVNQVCYTARTAYGEYFRKTDPQFTGTVYSPADVGLDVSFAIPRIPFLSFNINDWTHIGTKTIGSDSTTYFDLSSYQETDTDYNEPMLPMASFVDYTDTNIWLEDATNEVGMVNHHKIVIEHTLKTHDDYILVGAKGFSYRWDFRVASNGNCNGVAVTMFSDPQYFQDTLIYTLNRS